LGEGEGMCRRGDEEEALYVNCKHKPKIQVDASLEAKQLRRLYEIYRIPIYYYVPLLLGNY